MMHYTTELLDYNTLLFRFHRACGRHGSAGRGLAYPQGPLSGARVCDGQC